MQSMNALVQPTITKLFQRQRRSRSRRASVGDGFSQNRRTGNTGGPPTANRSPAGPTPPEAGPGAPAPGPRGTSRTGSARTTPPPPSTTALNATAAATTGDGPHEG